MRQQASQEKAKAATWTPEQRAQVTQLKTDERRAYDELQSFTNQMARKTPGYVDDGWLRFPFEQWSEKEGYLQAGWFDDDLDRSFDQDSFSNFADVGAQFEGDFDEPWSEVFPFEDHAILESLEDVDYEGEQDITSWYTMLDLPLSKPLTVIGGLRFETGVPHSNGHAHAKKTSPAPAAKAG